MALTDEDVSDLISNDGTNKSTLNSQSRKSSLISLDEPNIIQKKVTIISDDEKSKNF